MNLDKERKRLSQAANLAWLRRDWKPTDMVPVLQKPSENSQDGSIYSTLIPADKIQLPLAPPGEYWPPDATVFLVWQEEGREISCINRDLEGNSYFVIARRFGERKWLEIDPDFRFFHNLFHNTATNEYLKRDRVDDSQEEVVVVVESSGVKIRFKELCDFLKFKGMYLGLHFSCTAYSEHSLAALELSQNEAKPNRTELQDGYLSWKYYCFAAPRDGYQSESVLDAKRLIGFSEIGKEKPVKFIADVDENGYKTTLSCDEGLEAWTHFRKQVLDKYYREHDRYTVEDTVLICHGSNGGTEWILPIDDDHDDKVCAKSSDFALIPYEEQWHWKTYNIPPKGNISATYLKRYRERSSQVAIISHGGGPRVSSTRPEHLFRQRYNELQAVCDTNLGWQLVRPFGTVASANRYIVLGTPLIIRYSGPDEYHLRCLRVPFLDNQVDFDWLILSITKILVDSLNQERLKDLISDQEQAKLDQKKDDPEQSDPKGIDYLEAALSSFKVENAKCHIKFLRRLQGIRSTGSAHRKGKSYRRSVKYFKLKQLGLRQGFAAILRQAIKVLEFFIYIVQRGELSGKKELPLLCDLNEHLGELSKTLFPAEAEGISTDETWMRETVPWSEHLANHLMTKVVPKFDGSPSKLMKVCEPQITSLKPDATRADVRSAITYIAKVFIQAAPSSLQYATRILSRAEGTSMPTTEVFEKTASRVTYAKKLVDFSLGFVNHDEVADSAWYRHYVAHLLFYVSCYTAYTYTHVLRADGLDSTSVISDLVSIVQSATDVAENIAGDDAKNHLLAVKKAAKDLAQAVSHK